MQASIFVVYLGIYTNDVYLLLNSVFNLYLMPTVHFYYYIVVLIWIWMYG